VRLEIFKHLIDPLTPGSLVDLGTGHGAFAVLAHDAGWNVTAVDARPDRWPETVGIQWIQKDVREFDPSGFDVVCMLGLLYHLEVEDQVLLLQRAAGTTLIIDTHVAEFPVVDVAGYQGQYFIELTDKPTASWNNERSFWPTEASFLRMLKDAGYSNVMKLDPPYYPFRTFYYCPGFRR
jgi:hypothetical protein